jgi:hypothetical protein
VPSIAFPLGVFSPHEDGTAPAQRRAQRTPQRGNFGVSEKPNLYGRAQKDRRALTAQRPTCANSAGVGSCFALLWEPELSCLKSSSIAPKYNTLSRLRAASLAYIAPIVDFI